MSAKRDLIRPDRWLQNLYEKRPVLFNLLALGIALLIFGFALLIKWVVLP